MRNTKLRYYLRGLGIGMLVTAAIWAVSAKEEPSLTDAQIREKAIELGMVDGDSLVLSDLQTNTKSEDTDEDWLTVETEMSDEAEETTEIEQTSEDVQTTEEETISEEEQPSEEQISEEEEIIEQGQVSENQTEAEQEQASMTEQTTTSQVSGELNQETNTATFVIRSGANSYRVSKVLEEIGLIENAQSFDNYLCNNGYSKRIHTGSYMIAVGTSEEDIAKIITGSY